VEGIGGMKLREYRDDALRRITVQTDETVRAAMARMNAAGLRLLPVCDRDGLFAGVLADGDLRRFLAGGGDADARVVQALNATPRIIDSEMDDHDVRSVMLRRGVEYLPLVMEGRIRALYSLWLSASAQELTAVIMAGGLGQRLAPLTETCPKPLLDVGGKPILSRIIDHLRDQGISRFILSLNYLGDMIVDHFGDGSGHDVQISYVRETSRLGTGGALSLLDENELSDPFLCLNGDLLNDLDVTELLDEHQRRGWEATMVTRMHGYTVPYGVVQVGEGNVFLGSQEKPTMQFPINAGIYMLSKRVVSYVPRNTFYDAPTLFSELIAKGHKVGTFNHTGRWIDIGNIAELTRARKIFEESES
jgi:dTDP-glucose pyrophosphorylase